MYNVFDKIEENVIINASACIKIYNLFLHIRRIFMRKINAILFTAVMVVSLAGCGGKQENTVENNKSYTDVTDNESQEEQGVSLDEETGLTPDEEAGLKPEADASLVIWEDSAERIEYMEFVGAQFTEKYGIDVKVEPVVDFSNRLIQDAPANIGPDLVEAPHDNMGNLIAAGLIQPNDNTADIIKTDFIDSAANCVIYNDQVYGYPLSINTYALIYNKELVDTPAKSFQEIIEFAKTFNNPKKNQYALMWQVNSTYYSHCFLAGYGAYVFGNNGSDKDDIGLNSTGAIEGAKFFHSLKDILNVKSADTDTQIIDGLFTSGKVAYTISGQWAVSSYQKAGVDVGVAPLPELPNGENANSFLGVQGLYISSYSKYPNAAKLFAEMASSEEMLLKRYEITHEVPAIKSLIDREEIQTDEITSVFLQQAQNSTPMPSIPQMGVVWDPYMRALQSIWDNDLDPQKAMDECVSIIKNSILAQE